MEQLIRVTFKARDNGQIFPVYFKTEAEISEASVKLNSDEVERRPSDTTEFMIEQMAAVSRILELGGR